MSDHVHRPMWPPHGFVDSAPCADCGDLIDLRVCLDSLAAHERIAKEEHERAEQAEAEVERWKVRMDAALVDLESAKARVVEAAPNAASEILRHLFPLDFTSVRDYDGDRQWIAAKIVSLAQPEEKP